MDVTRLHRRSSSLRSPSPWRSRGLLGLATSALLLFTLTGCAPRDPTPSLLPTPVHTPPPLTAEPPRPTPSPTPPPQVLTVCMAEEPNTLFVYGSPSRAARNVLEAIYDGPVDTRSYRFEPVILEGLPSPDNGGVLLHPVTVAEGARVVDASGRAVTLRPGVTVLDAEGDEVVFEGGSITLTQTVVSFTLRAGLTWSDGAPLTAADSVYSFELAGAFLDRLPLHTRLLHDQTERYAAADERTVVWASLPGYHDTFNVQGFRFQNFYVQNFFSPLPRHTWGTSSPEWLDQSEAVRERPLGWGAFAVEEWVRGDHLTLVRNPAYFRAAEGLPVLERVTFRFVPDLQQGLERIARGECDMLTQDVLEREAVHTGSLAPLIEAALNGQVQLVTAPSTEWEHLDFNVQPAEHAKRPPFFTDVRTRRAVAMCVHRERIAGEALPYGLAALAESYVAAEHPAYAGERLDRIPYDPSAALALLDELGWRDADGDGVREAHGVPGIAENTPFSVTLLTNSGHLAHERTARILTENLAACGIALTVEYLPGEQLFADGPDGPLFGRRFDLALFSWLNDVDPPCWLYLSSEIPSSANWWATSNNPGYANPDFDAACQAALMALPGSAAYTRWHSEAQRIFSQDVPVLPLHFVPKLVVTRPGVGGVLLDPTEYLDLWNIEAFEVRAEGGPS